MFLKVAGHSITKQGSGMRSTLEIFIRLFDPEVRVLCIDEPELGLEPFLQKYLFQAIKEKAGPDKKIILATHSHHFLDYEDIGANYVCERNSAGKIGVTQATDLKPIIFRLLGNTLSSMLLPEKILILEGSSDNTYLTKCLSLLNKQGFAVHNSRSNGNISYAINAITQFLQFNAHNIPVYQEHTYVIADQAKNVMVREWQRLLSDHATQLLVLTQNGIEYYYPERLLQQVFNSTDSTTVIVDGYLRANPNEYNGVRLSKNQLSQRISELIQAEDLTDPGNELFVFLNQLP